MWWTKVLEVPESCLGERADSFLIPGEVVEVGRAFAVAAPEAFNLL